MKKVAGVLFILIAIVLSLSFLAALPKIVGIVIRGISGNDYAIGYMVGTLTMWGLTCTAIYFLLK